MKWCLENWFLRFLIFLLYFFFTYKYVIFISYLLFTFCSFCVVHWIPPNVPKRQNKNWLEFLLRTAAPTTVTTVTPYPFL